MASEWLRWRRGGKRALFTMTALLTVLASCEAVSGFDDLVFDLPSGGRGGDGGEGGSDDSCTSNEDCSSGFCANGMCCDRACDSPCEACALDGSEGICTPLEVSDTPNACDGVCDGAGSCVSGKVVWSRQLGDAELDSVTGVAIDSEDDIVLAGQFSGTVDFGDQSLTGDEDGFIVKLNPDGEPKWSLLFESTIAIDLRDIAVDADDNIVVVGDVDGQLSLDGTDYAATAGGADILVVKLSPAGAVSYVGLFGSGGHDRATSVAVDDDGNMIFAGNFTSLLDFGSGVLQRFGGPDAYVAKLDPSGNHLWSRSAGGNGVDSARACTVVGDSNDATLHVGGHFSNQIDLGAGTLNGIDPYDGYMGQLDELGTAAWQVGLLGPGEQFVRTMTPLAGGLVVGGTLDTQADIVETTLTSAGDEDAWVARLGSTGAVAWAMRHGGGGRDELWGIATDPAESIVLTGEFVDGIDFGGEMLAGAGGADVFVAKLTADGAHLWSQRFGFAGAQIGRDVAIDSSRSIVVVGEFEDSIRFDQDQYTSQGNSDIFIVKLAP